jgi:hypothetical protein
MSGCIYGPVGLRQNSGDTIRRGGGGKINEKSPPNKFGGFVCYKFDVISYYRAIINFSFTISFSVVRR